MTQKFLHTTPPADQLPERMQALCDFANRDSTNDSEGPFLHPVMKAIVMHFMLHMTTPFVMAMDVQQEHYFIGLWQKKVIGLWSLSLYLE